MVSYIKSAISYVNPWELAENQVDSGRKKEEIVVEKGFSDPVVDGIRNVLSIPWKLMYFSDDINSGDVSPEVIEMTKNYLHENGLHDVNVSVNQYKPQAAWQRVFSNPRTSLITKMTLGVINAASETVLCNKFTGLGGDYYDPMTNTINLLSNNSAIALRECGRAKFFNEKSNVGSYLITPFLLDLTALKSFPICNASYQTLTELASTARGLSSISAYGPKLTTDAVRILIPSLFIRTFMNYKQEQIIDPFNGLVNSQWNIANLSDLLTSTLKTLVPVIVLSHIVGNIWANAIEKAAAEAEKRKQTVESLQTKEVEKTPVEKQAEAVPSVSSL